MTVIRVKDLSFSYEKDAQVLSRLNLDFDHRPTAIIGQNGAGKTTFVKLLKGLLKPDAGDISVSGIDVRRTTAASLAKVIGLVFQNPDEQIFKGKVLDEVMFGPLNIGMDESKARENALSALEMVGLNDKAAANPHDLSLSEKKLVCLAAVVAMDTDIIILDEPTIGQDYAGKEQIKAIIQTLTAQQKLVMTIIHDMDFVAECFERVIVFYQGKIIMDGTPREVFAKQDVLQKAYLEPPAITQLGAALGYVETFLTVDEFVAKAKG